MAIKTINGILKPDSSKTSEEFNTQIKNACDQAETIDTNDYVGLVFNLRDKRIDFIPSTNISNTFGVNDTVIVAGSESETLDPYIRDNGIPSTVGGASAGTTFNGTVSDALDKILYPYVKPTFTTFYLNGQNATLEVGDKIVAGTKTFTWTSTTSSNIKTNSISILSGTDVLASSIANDGNEQLSLISDIIKNTATTHTFYLNAQDTQNNPVTKQYVVNWRWKIYFGSSDKETLISNDVNNFQNTQLITSRAGTYLTNSNGYKWVCYPTTFGLATKFEDTNTGFSIAMEQPTILSVTNSFGVSSDYYCYRTTNIMANTLSIKIS